MTSDVQKILNKSKTSSTGSGTSWPERSAASGSLPQGPGPPSAVRGRPVLLGYSRESAPEGWPTCASNSIVACLALNPGQRVVEQLLRQHQLGRSEHHRRRRNPTGSSVSRSWRWTSGRLPYLSRIFSGPCLRDWYISLFFATSWVQHNRNGNYSM
jgi:hypothetical protein